MVITYGLSVSWVLCMSSYPRVFLASPWSSFLCLFHVLIALVAGNLRSSHLCVEVVCRATLKQVALTHLVEIDTMQLTLLANYVLDPSFVVFGAEKPLGSTWRHWLQERTMRSLVLGLSFFWLILWTIVKALSLFLSGLRNEGNFPEHLLLILVLFLFCFFWNNILTFACSVEFFELVWNPRRTGLPLWHVTLRDRKAPTCTWLLLFVALIWVLHCPAYVGA